jgi:8-oxo-dGTP diphosphatase
MRLFGLDGCKQNAWVAAESDLDFREIRFRIEADLQRLFDQAFRGEAIAVLDVPIGLSDSPRECDVAARKLLGRRGGSAVFRPPCREALATATYEEALAVNRAHCHRIGVALEAFHIRERIKAVDDLMTPKHQQGIREGHPEVCFVVLNGGRPLPAGKKSAEGIAERLALLTAAGVPAFDPSSERIRLGRSRVEVDDVVDAAVMLVTARDVALGTGRSLAEGVEERDGRGLLMQMWAPAAAPQLMEDGPPPVSAATRPFVGVAVLVRRGDRVLLLKRKRSHGAGTWCPPGGHLEFGESPEECAVREAKEETGVKVADVRFLAITNDVFPEGKHYITIWFEGQHLAGEGTAAAVDKVSEVNWFTWDALPEPRFLSLRHLLEGKSLPPVIVESKLER